jgi:hypothetical protein
MLRAVEIRCRCARPVWTTSRRERDDHRSTEMGRLYWAMLAPFGFVALTLGLLAVGGG